MHAPTALPLLRRLGRALAYLLFQLLLALAYLLRSLGALRLPFGFGHAAPDDAVLERSHPPQGALLAGPAL